MGTQPQSKSVEAEPEAPGGSETSTVGPNGPTDSNGAARGAPPEARPAAHRDPGPEPETPIGPAPGTSSAARMSPAATNGAVGNGSATEARPTDEGPPGPAADVEVIEAEELSTTTRRKRRLTSWVGLGAKKVVSKIYATSADDLEERARRAVGSAYRDQADDLEERAVRAMRQAILSEADKIKEAVEHGVEIKRREVRLSLVVLVTASLVYLALYWFTRSGPSG